MGKTGPRPRARGIIGGGTLLAAALSIAGCAHRDVVDTPVGWWHDLEGGAIAQQRPPPPGVNDPYPRIGTTPAHAPVVASLDLRHSVTSALLRQRNLTTRLDANDPIPDAVVLAPASASPSPASPAPVAGPLPAAAPPPAPGGSSAMLDAAEAPPNAAAAHAPSSRHAAKGDAETDADMDSAPELALPAIQVQAPDVAGGPVTIPQIPGAPPSGPHLPGIAYAAGLPVAARLPDYKVEPVVGTRIDFTPGTDAMLPGQLAALHAIAVRRGLGTLFVHGYGDSAGPDPDAQAQALSVAALRARVVAEALQAEGVPAGSILLRAQAFGRGASVTLVQ